MQPRRVASLYDILVQVALLQHTQSKRARDIPVVASWNYALELVKDHIGRADYFPNINPYRRALQSTVASKRAHCSMARTRRRVGFAYVMCTPRSECGGSVVSGCSVSCFICLVCISCRKPEKSHIAPRTNNGGILSYNALVEPHEEGSAYAQSHSLLFWGSCAEAMKFNNLVWAESCHVRSVTARLTTRRRSITARLPKPI